MSHTTQIATWKEINKKVGSAGTPLNKCPSYIEINNTGKADISGSYKNTQLLPLTAISYRKPLNGIRFTKEEGIYIRYEATYPLASNVIVDIYYIDINDIGRGQGCTMTKGNKTGTIEVEYRVKTITGANFPKNTDDIYWYAPIYQ